MSDYDPIIFGVGAACCVLGAYIIGTEIHDAYKRTKEQQELYNKVMGEKRERSR
jgi:hypothetical protein